MKGMTVMQRDGDALIAGEVLVLCLQKQCIACLVSV